jgi:hypothetical protein
MGLVLVLAASACSAAGPRAPDAPTTLTSASSCAGLGVLLDLRADLMEGVPVVGVPGYLAQLDAQLASLALAERRLVTAGPSGRPMLADIRTVASAIDAQRKKTEALASNLEGSYASTSSALDEACTCQGVDLRVLEAPPHASKTERTVAAIAAGTPEAKAQRALNRKVAESKACAGANRLLAAMRSLDVTSKISTAAVGQHLSEMNVEGPTVATRDVLARALLDHSKNLAAFAAATEPAGAAKPAQTEVAALFEQLD